MMMPKPQKMTQRFLSLLLTLAMLVSLFPATAAARDLYAEPIHLTFQQPAGGEQAVNPFKAYPLPKDVPYQYEKITWYDEQGEVLSTGEYGDYFYSGETYKLHVVLRFPRDQPMDRKNYGNLKIPVTINGQTCTNVTTESFAGLAYYMELWYTFPPASKKEISVPVELVSKNLEGGGVVKDVELRLKGDEDYYATELSSTLVRAVAPVGLEKKSIMPAGTNWNFIMDLASKKGAKFADIDWTKNGNILLDGKANPFSQAEVLDSGKTLRVTWPVHVPKYVIKKVTIETDTTPLVGAEKSTTVRVNNHVYDDISYDVTKVSWDASGKPQDTGNTFEYDKKYTLVTYIKPRDNAELAPEADLKDNVLVNGQPATITYDGKNLGMWVAYTFPKTPMEQLKDFVDVTISEPVLGEAPKWDVTLNEGDYSFSSTSEILWYKGSYPCSSINMMEAGDLFESGQMYTAVIPLEINSDSSRTFQNYAGVRLNGKAVEYRELDSSHRVIEVYQTFTMPEAVTAQVTEPMGGQYPDEDARLEIGEYTYATTSPVIWYEGTSHSGGADIMDGTKPFEKGKQYTATLTLEAYEANGFDRYAGFFINKQPASLYALDETCIMMYRTFTAGELPDSEKKQISFVKVETVKTPEVGVSFDDLTEVTVPEDADYEVVEVQWSNADGSPLEEGAVLESGKAYRCELVLGVTSEASMFLQDKQNMVAEINGSVINEIDSSSTKDTLKIICYVQIGEAEEPTEPELIQLVEIMDVTAPEAEKAFDKTANVPANAPYEVDQVTWLDAEGNALQDSAQAEAGATYRCQIQLKPTSADYVFPQDKTTIQATINGNAPDSIENSNDQGSFILYKNFTVAQSGGEDPEQEYLVTVINGSGSGSYKEGETVTITANPAEKGTKFNGWSIISGGIVLEDASQAETTFVMPGNKVEVKALYTAVSGPVDPPAVTYAVTVVNGRGSGNYEEGETVAIQADPAPSGQEFDRWKVLEGNVTLAKERASSTTFTMPGKAVKLEATYKAQSSNSNNGGGGVSLGVIGGGQSVTLDSSKNGKVTSDKKTAGKGSTVTLTVKPDAGYELDEIIVTDSKGNEVKLTDKGKGKYSFAMPATKVSVETTFKKIAEPEKQPTTPEKVEMPFTDVTEKDWFYDSVAYVYDKGLIAGTGATTFAPSVTTTRGMIVTILYRLEGKPLTMGGSSFTDVKSGSYYEKAIIWAADKGIVSGYGNGNFGPNDTITREQMASIFYRYAQNKKYDVSVGENTNILSYKDFDKISSYAVAAMQWACGGEMIQERDAGMMAPKEGATRAEVAFMLHHFCQNYEL